MDKILYGSRCRCREDVSITKKRKKTFQSEGKPIAYPKRDEPKNIVELTDNNQLYEIPRKTFHIKYEKNLSATAKLILNSFQNKYVYYAIDDILYGLKANLDEQENLLTILYSSIISLQNNFYVNFFDIWISEIYINEIPKQLSKNNRFLCHHLSSSKKFNFITIKLFYEIRPPAKKQEILW